MFRATALRVLIASPSDVANDRGAIESAVHDWNALYSEDMSVVLLPVRWETHASPEMGNSPQEIINHQLVDTCDVLIACFGSRIGTPTALAESGTIEEIQRFITADRRALIYFSNTATSLDEIDSEQLRARNRFREEMTTKGLLGRYQSVDDLRSQVSTALLRTIRSMKLTEIHHIIDGGSPTSFPNPTVAANKVGSEPDVYSALESHRRKWIKQAVTWKARWVAIQPSQDVDEWKRMAEEMRDALISFQGDIAVSFVSRTSALASDIGVLTANAQELVQAKFYMNAGLSHIRFQNAMELLIKNILDLADRDWRTYIATSLPVSPS